MIKITDSLPRPEPQFTIDPEVLERIRRNASAGLPPPQFITPPSFLLDAIRNAGFRSIFHLSSFRPIRSFLTFLGQNNRITTTPKRPRSDSDLSQSESAKRLRSSLRSSSKNLPPSDLSQNEDPTGLLNNTNQKNGILLLHTLSSGFFFSAPFLQFSLFPFLLSHTSIIIPYFALASEPEKIVTAKSQSQPPHVQTRSRSTSIAVEPPEDDINALLTFARDVKHRGDEDRKASHDTVKRNPRAVRSFNQISVLPFLFDLTRSVIHFVSLLF